MRVRLISLLCLVLCSFVAQAESLDLKLSQDMGASVQVGVSHADLTANNPSWKDVFVRGNVRLEKEGVLNWDVSQQKHFNETGTAVAVGYTRDINADWYAFIGASIGNDASFLPSQRFDFALNRKWLTNRQLVTGIQLTDSRSGDKRYRDQALQFSASYYFDFPLVAEIGLRSNTSSPGAINTQRYFASATYGKAKERYLSVRYDMGREGYLPAGSGVSALDFPSHVFTLGWRQWFTHSVGFDLGAERYSNPFYQRNGVSASVFIDF